MCPDAPAPGTATACQGYPGNHPTGSPASALSPGSPGAGRSNKPPGSRYPRWRYSAAGEAQRCACRTSSGNDRVRVPASPCCRRSRAAAARVPADRCSPDQAPRGWRAASSRCWWGRCGAPPARAGPPESDRAAASGLRDRRSVRSTARWSAPADAACAPGRG